MEFLKNITPRKYQKEITKTCLKKNCLVVLPTGLGKTLIALMTAIERIKEYPLKKVVFLAPTKPLAEQHQEYFKKNLGELFGAMELFTGAIKSENRKKIWRTADIIFSTPQCIANDVKKRLYDLSEVSLLIQDEAHRCVKNYDYNFIAQKYVEQGEDTRLIGLTASPGSDGKKIKEIMKNLSIKEVELRTRESEDVKEYLQELEFEKVEVELPKEFIKIKKILQELSLEYTEWLRKTNFLFGPDTKINLINLQKKLSFQINKNYSSPSSFSAVSKVSQAIKISHASDLLETQTLEGFFKYLKNILNQAEKKQSKGVVQLTSKQEFNLCYAKTYELLNKGEEHPKIQEIIKIIRNEKLINPNLKTMIFTQFRDTATVVTRNLNKLKNINCEVFVGQAKKGDTGLSQKEQKEIITKFKEKEINTLCATSIAEEGLDIPEVDLVIFYEPISSAIRSIQRRGRTARMSKGKLIILITKNTKDQFAYYASISREKKMKNEIEKIKKEMNSPQKKLK
ncbi:MAG: DEAD/DEAH box helicase [Nanoarchaeota archaeon]|nr:DEAD/DEAH box helicase [Nanoarchaeota archaeon]